MIYLIDPSEVYGDTGCKAVTNHILYGIPPCIPLCPIFF